MIDTSTTDSNRDCAQPKRFGWPTIAHAILLISGIVLTCYLHPYFVESAIRKLDTPETAMYGMLRVDAGNSNALAFISLAIGWLFVAFLYWRNPRLCRWSVIPVFALLPLYSSVREVSDRIDSTPAFQENYYASWSDLRSFAQSVKAGTNPATPAQVGRFRIVRCEVLASGAVVLYTHEDRQGKPELWGFVWHPNQPYSEAWATAVGISGDAGEWNRVKTIDTEWFVLFNYYHFIKRGWS